MKNKERISFKQTWLSLVNLTLMQLKEKMNISFKKNLKKTLLKLSLFIIAVAAVSFLSFGLIFLSKKFHIFSIQENFPQSVLVVFFTTMVVLSLISTTAKLVNTLYISKDNLFLLTLPASSSIVFSSKLCVHYILELKNNFLFIIPLFFGYGIASKLAWYYYPWVIFIFMLIAILIILISSLLSIPCLYVYIFVKNRSYLRYPLLAIAGIGVFILVYKLIGLIPSNINILRRWQSISAKLNNFLSTFQTKAYPMSMLVKLIAGDAMTFKVFHEKTLSILLVLLLTILVLFALSYLISKPLFYSMASKPFEYNKKDKTKIRKENRLSPFLAVLKKEWLLSLRSGALIKMAFILLLVLPLSIQLLNALYAAMNKKYLGLQLTVSFNMLITLLFVLSTNIELSSAYSKDGSASYLNKLQPSSSYLILFAKLTPNLVIGLLGIGFTTYVYGLNSGLLVKEMIRYGLIIAFVFIAHLFASAQRDISNPQDKQYATFQNQQNNPNENASTIGCFIQSFLFAGLWLFFSLDNAFNVWNKIIIFSLIYLVISVILYIMKIKVYYKES